MGFNFKMKMLTLTIAVPLRYIKPYLYTCCEVISHSKLYNDGINGVSLVSFLRPREDKKYIYRGGSRGH